ncbi:ATPase synthesis protein 25 [Penicillium hispanicum]|uniref:ATPase synthesis protein 25 n=1 Tax=Penicillium hispanicum TaxID=1080232 RepID=UPI00253FC2DC|nr:ATPase synthesis protein 25 [Penicillium hispanicum]KAJ5585019.1 ATPase synthesis protein 25 [Penicillium hispanicum]
MPRYVYTIRPSVNSRAFSAVGPARSDRPPISNHPEIHLSPAEENVSAPEGPVSESTHVPWYLQEGPLATEERPMTDGYIPQTPENSPEMLPVLLEHAYKDLGLDGLKLFDLRGLDVPAALGANVIMIIGTARSVKHLNVSADRLCRWLRSKYKLSPYADGLLGRNELKIKLRRKAKRARAASQAGAMIDEKDDGITTGWICVNAGVVDKNNSKTELSDLGFEGFGQIDTGVSVVVQIFTEEKRAEIDLDGLWQDTLDRADRKKFRNSSEEASKTESSANSQPSLGSMSTPRGQRRGIHTAHRSTTSGHISSLSGLADVLDATPATAKAPGIGMSTESLLTMLAGLPHESARAELGTGPDDNQSTLFLRLLYASFPKEMSTKEIALLHLRLFSIAVSRQHSQYSKDTLLSMFNEYLSSGYDFSDDLGFDIVTALLAPRQVQHHSDSAASYLPEQDVELALQVLERLSLRGVPILNFKVFNLLYRVAEVPTTEAEALKQATSSAEEDLQTPVGKSWSPSQRQMITRLSKIVAAAEVPFDEEEARQLMFTQFRFKDYDGFWRIWRQLPLKGARRTQEDYTQLFQLHADLGEEQRARDCLSTWVPIMHGEMTPIVLQGPIVTAIMHCLLVADPDIQSRADEGSPSYYSYLWTECQQALAREA